MTVTKRHTLEVLREPALNNAANEHIGNNYQSDGYGEMVLDGTEPLDVSHTSALVCHGLILCSPITPKVTVMVHMLNLYHTTHQCCPHLSIQAYIKLLCDMHGVLFHNHCSQQFSITLDIYLQVLAFVSNLVHCVLQHDQPDWWLKHSCPPCTYRLQDEPAMCFSMLFTQDGNDSLKQVATRILDGDVDHVATSLPTSEHTFHHEQYLTHEFVDKFASDQQMGHSIVDEDGDGNLCVFIVVCRHGFCLLIADMVQSGEQSKYALAVTSKLLDAFGPDLGGSYDIGCQFKTTLASSVLGKHARSLNYMSLVNAFMLDNLTTYIEGLGLEDLEGCEWAFSKSNALASSTRSITSYFEHSDEMKVYANLTKFLLNNYKQALNILSNGHMTLDRLMCKLRVSDPAIFKLWLDKECVYLKSLLHKLPEETLQMEYWQQLINLATSRQDLEVILSTWTIVTTQSAAPIWSDSSATRRRETMHRHTQENYKKDLKVVQELEGCLRITCHWVPEDKEWQAAAHLVANQKYQHALDNIERLVVSHIFKLSKMNQSGTSRSILLSHIGKALQMHLAAIQAALTHYNTAVKALGHQTLEFDEVVEYAFLADFDLLRDTQQDVSTCLWASPTAQLAINTYFKLCQAKEEVVCLNVEIHHIMTYLIDKDHYIQACEALYQDAHPALAYQISRYHTIHSRFTPLHLHYLEKISHLPGFNGMLSPGISTGEEDMDEDADEDHGATLEEQCEALQNILSVTTDA
ncbi:hypothetical protein EDD16DRAFT_1692465 [Pisolithus croceorrhizus]|nr:hypothetical protein EDD16DRAFT_1692465 [Pisolithus croceorrhizus]